MNRDITTPWTTEVRTRKITPSTGWVRKIVNGVIVSALWCTWWKDHNNGTLCIRRCTKNLEKSSNKKKQMVNRVATKLAGVECNNNGCTKSCELKHSYKNVEIVTCVTTAAAPAERIMRFSKSSLKSARLDLLNQIFLLNIYEVASLTFNFSTK